MLLLHYILLPLKQLIRLRMALFFTVILPVMLYFIYGHTDQPIYVITFFNFAIQSAMLQSVGIFVTSHKNSAWGQYVSNLPVSRLYPVAGILLSMFIIGLSSVLLISMIDLFYYHALTGQQLVLAIFVSAMGAFPMGALGYLIGLKFDPMTARNILTFANLIFLFITFVPAPIQKILAYFSFPNAWLQFSLQFVLNQHFNLYQCLVVGLYVLVFLLLIQKMSLPKKYYDQV